MAKSLIKMMVGGSVFARIPLAEVVSAVAKGADIDERDESDMTPLDAAISAQWDDIAWWLIENGACLHKLPLYFAAQTGNLKLVEYFLQQGIDPNQSWTGYTPLLVCYVDSPAFARRNLVVHQTTGGKKKKITDPQAAAQLAAEVLGEDRYANFLPIARLLVEKGADINYRHPKSLQCALHYSGDRGGDDLARYALEQGALPNFQDVSGLTPLHYAARKGRLEIVETLLGAGADPNIAEDYGFTPLHEAAENKQEKIAELLLSHGADKSKALTQDFEDYRTGFTAADVARKKKHTRLVRLLS